MANFDRVVRDNAAVSMETGEPIGHHPSLFRTVQLLNPLRPFLPLKCGSQMHYPRDQLRHACCHLANIIGDIDKIRAMSPFATLHWPLLYTLSGQAPDYLADDCQHVVASVWRSTPCSQLIDIRWQIVHCCQSSSMERFIRSAVWSCNITLTYQRSTSHFLAHFDMT